MSHETCRSLENDGYRALLFTPSRPGGPTLLQSRRGSLIQRHFPDLVTAAPAPVRPGPRRRSGRVVGRPAFLRGAPAPRLLRRPHRQQLADAMPAHFIAFDILQIDGQQLLTEPYERRRAALEGLFTEHGLTPPWTLCPMTTDVAVAQEWLTSWTSVPGVEGLVIKGLGQRYLPGARGWFKVRRRDTTEAIVGGVTGTLSRPQLLVLGRYDEDRRLRAVGRTAPLHPDAARQLADHLTAAGPEHPWTGVRFTATWGSREPLEASLVVPELVAEVSADTAIDRGAWRHPLRFVRLRLDVTVAHVPSFGEGVQPSSG
ncbi:ATP-dependent DNA ligase [Streptomyces agglomeratus]|uniref:ATP-dependent DNA ligase n=1 Tax=Streptomyces agglomeratus TaxID=285458 RepID=UPI001F0A9472|nr:ATP-dependent DNA ligase [Streptomyces agglomeratus]